MRYLEVLSAAHEVDALAIAGSRPALAEALARMRRLAGGSCFEHFLHEAALLEALDDLQSGDDPAGDRLRAALRRARADGFLYTNLFRWSRALRMLLGRALELDIERDYVLG
ncbi:MAG: hypothetical protein IPK20_25700 [Betaproteobacteria bacterium]|nr:hypothetical protein [Betaproteobacteria bacterium]